MGEFYMVSSPSANIKPSQWNLAGSDDGTGL